MSLNKFKEDFTMKKSIKLVMSFLLVVAIMIPVALLPASAASSYQDSVASVNQQDNGTTVGNDATQNKSTSYVDNITSDGDNSVDTYVSQASTFNVKLPKVIILNGTHGQTNSGAYEVEVEGNIAADEVVSCTPPDSAFSLSSTGKADIEATVSQSKSEFTYADGVRIGQSVVATGTVTASNMTAGEWHGQYEFEVSLDVPEAEQDNSLVYMLDISRNGSLFDNIDDYDRPVGMTVDGITAAAVEDQESMLSYIPIKGNVCGIGTDPTALVFAQEGGSVVVINYATTGGGTNSVTINTQDLTNETALAIMTYSELMQMV